MALAGQHLGAYRLVKLIKHGTKREIYQAEDTSQSRSVIVTVILLDSLLCLDATTFKQAVATFHQQAAMMMRLAHPFLNPLLSYGTETQGTSTYLYLASATTADGTLDDYLQRSSGLLTPEDVSRVIEQLAAALQYVHAHGFVHGEIKPSYVAIKRCDTHHIYQVCLDGLAVTHCVAAVYATSTIRGNPTYLAPEQWQAHATTASDQYALATLAYKFLTGHAPFHGSLEQLKQQHLHARAQPASLLNRQLPHEVDDVLAHALAKNSKSRYRSVSAFAQALLRAVQSGSSSRSRSVGQSSPSHKQVPAATNLTAFNANLLFFLFCTGLIGIGACVVLNAYGLLPSPIAIFGYSLGGLITFIASGWVLFGKLFSKDMWLKARRLPVVVTSLLTVGVILTAAVYVPILNYDPYIHQGMLAWSDTLANNIPDHKWRVTATSAGSCQFLQGAYHAHAPSNLPSNLPFSAIPCTSQSDTSEFANFVYEVQMKFLAGTCGGIFFRENMNMGDAYYFSVCTNGSYNLQIFQHYTMQESLDNAYVSPQVDMTRPLLLAVVAYNGDITAYINHQRVTIFHKQTLVARGHIGVGATSTYGNLPTEVAFSNARIWSLDS